MTKKLDYQKLMDKARKTNEEYERIEKEGEFASPLNCSSFVCLRTVEVAIETGIKEMNWDCVAEGLDLLRNLLEKIEKDKKFSI